MFSARYDLNLLGFFYLRSFSTFVYTDTFIFSFRGLLLLFFPLLPLLQSVVPKREFSVSGRIWMTQT